MDSLVRFQFSPCGCSQVALPLLLCERRELYIAVRVRTSKQNRPTGYFQRRSTVPLLPRSPAGCVCMHPAMLCCVVSGCLHFVECRVDRVWVCVRRHYRPGHRRADGVRVRAAACAPCLSGQRTTVRHTPMTDRRDVRHVRRASMQTRKPVGGKCAF